jgi:uncharacterized protein (TIGR03437 family)
VFPARLGLAILCTGMAWGAAPSYSATGIRSSGSFALGPFSPNSLISIFGEDLATTERGLTVADIVNGALPNELNSTRVYIDSYAVPLFYVSKTQINLLIPAKQPIGKAEIQVVRQGVYGPVAIIDIAAASPALFMNGEYAIATHADNSLIHPGSPARSGELVVIYAAGLGKAERMPGLGELIPYTSQLIDLGIFRVTLNGVAVDPARLRYAGLTPASAGLYQVNLVLSENLAPDPELRLFVGDAGSQAGLRLAVR